MTAKRKLISKILYPLMYVHIIFFLCIGSDSDSSSSSDSESDVEKDAVFAKALFMQKSKEKGKKGRQSNDSTPVNSRSATPTVPGDGEEKGESTPQLDMIPSIGYLHSCLNNMYVRLLVKVIYRKYVSFR